MPNETPYLNAADMADLRRLDEVFSDGDGWDLPKARMQRLAELGVIQSMGWGRYRITAFGDLCLGSELSRLPLETADECNARLLREMESRKPNDTAALPGDVRAALRETAPPAEGGA